MSEIQKCPNMVRGGGSTYFILFPFHTIHLALLLFTGVCLKVYKVQNFQKFQKSLLKCHVNEWQNLKTSIQNNISFNFLLKVSKVS